MATIIRPGVSGTPGEPAESVRGVVRSPRFRPKKGMTNRPASPTSGKQPLLTRRKPTGQVRPPAGCARAKFPARPRFPRRCFGPRLKAKEQASGLPGSERSTQGVKDASPHLGHPCIRRGGSRWLFSSRALSIKTSSVFPSVITLPSWMTIVRSQRSRTRSRS